MKNTGLIDTSQFTKIDRGSDIKSKHFPVPFWVESVVCASIPYDGRRGTKLLPSKIDIYAHLIQLGYDYYHGSTVPEIPEPDFHLHSHTHDVLWIPALLNEQIKTMNQLLNVKRKESGLKHHRSVVPLFCALILQGTRVAQQTPPAI